MVGWMVFARVVDGGFDDFAALTAEMCAVARRETGVLVYERFIDDDSQDLLIHERYRNSECAIRHLVTFSERFSTRFEPLVRREQFLLFGDVSKQLVDRLRPLGAHRLSELRSGPPMVRAE